MKTTYTILLLSNQTFLKVQTNFVPVNKRSTGTAAQFTQIDSALVAAKKFIEDTIFSFNSFSLKLN